MEINKHGNSKASLWEYLPDTATLPKYLNSTDLIELSMCCKDYRNQLEPSVLENLGTSTWVCNNEEDYEALKNNSCYHKILKLLKSDIGNKLKFVKGFTIYGEINYRFAKKLVKLLSNIKSLKFYLIDYRNCEYSILTILKGMKQLEHLSIYIFSYRDRNYTYINKKHVFSKSLKSLRVITDYCDDEYLPIYETIDSSYVNLRFLTIGSNKMLENLSYEMPNLKEVELLYSRDLDSIKVAEFLKANPQVTKIFTEFDQPSKAAFKTILSSKSIEHWFVSREYSDEIEINNLPLNYSINHLSIGGYIFANLALKIINACKNLETLNLEDYRNVEEFCWSKLDHKINRLEVSYDTFTPKDFKDFDTLKLFNQIQFNPIFCDDDFTNELDGYKFNNYGLIPTISEVCTLKLID